MWLDNIGDYTIKRRPNIIFKMLNGNEDTDGNIIFKAYCRLDIRYLFIHLIYQIYYCYFVNTCYVIYILLMNF